jgi:hypothetical protein
MAAFFIDREGMLCSELENVVALREEFVDERGLTEYAVKNLDVVRVWPGPRGLHVQFRPERLGMKALARLVYLLSDAQETRVVLSYFHRRWSDEILTSTERATARILALVELVREPSSDAIFARSVQLDALHSRSPLHALAQHWKRRLSWRDFAHFVDRASDYADGRYVLFEHDRDRHAFVFRDFGTGLPEWGKHCLSTNRGRLLDDLPDDQFGRACSAAYGDTLDRFSPMLQAVDADISWPKFGKLRSRYWRLMLPITDPAGRIWLLSASHADPAIDLRHAG